MYIPYTEYDRFKDSVGLWSLEQLKPSVTKCIRVRDDAGRETDIGFDANTLNASALTTWLATDLLESTPLGTDANEDGLSDNWVELTDAGITSTLTCASGYQEIDITASTGSGFSRVYKNTPIKNGSSWSVDIDSFLVEKTGSGLMYLEVLILDSGFGTIGGQGDSINVSSADSDFVTRTLSGTVSDASAAYITVIVGCYASIATDTAKCRLKNAELTISNQSAYIAKWYDQSGNSNDATQSTDANQPRIVNAGTVETTDDGSYGIYFDGSDDYLDIADDTTLQITDAISIISKYDLVGAGYIITRNDDSSGTIQYGTYDDATKVYFYLQSDTRADDNTADLTSKLIVQTRETDDPKAYLNGVLKDTGSYGTTLTVRDNTQIGCRSNSADGSTKAVFVNAYINTISLLNQGFKQEQVIRLNEII